MNRIQRCLSALAALAAALIACIAAAPAALATPAPPDPNPANYPPPIVHTVLTSGMPGWQIALIVAGAAALAGLVAVLADRAWAARRQLTAPARPGA